VIACEDTRQTQKLLNHYGIETPTVSYHEHNEQSRAAELGEKLADGGRVAVVSDAGMPGISDPGFRLVSAAIERGVSVVPVPGAAAFASALVASGLPGDTFTFHGFLAPKATARRRQLDEIGNSRKTEIFYEAPHRISETLEDVVAILGAERGVVVARELTKVHEEFLRGSAGQILERIRSRGEIRGEITLLLAPAARERGHAISVSVRDRVDEIMREEKVGQKEALKKAAKERGISKSEAYREWQRTR
jgi:16S rRNA (cytidine1402-2'-O)-methyltransferase